MEDYGSLIWLLAIVGAGIYSMVTKAQKARGAGVPESEDASTHEAPESSLERTLRELLGEEAVPRRVKAPKSASGDTDPEAEADEVFTYDKQAEPEIFSYDTAAEEPHEVFSYDTAAEKPKEVFTYEKQAEQPQEVFSYDTPASREVASQEVVTRERLFSRNKTTKAPDKVGSMTTIQRTKHAADSSVTVPTEEIAFDYAEDTSEEIGAAERGEKSVKTAGDPLHDAPNETFDLRHAVIYSELLKPKFEE